MTKYVGGWVSSSVHYCQQIGLNNFPPEEVSRSGRQDSIMRNERERKGSFSLGSLDYFNGLNGFDEIL